MAVLNLHGQWKLCLCVIVCAVQAVVSAGSIVCLLSNSTQCIQGGDKVTLVKISYETFLGIPYAKPPVGQLRFANPVPNDPWTGIYDGTHEKPICIQRNGYLPLGTVAGIEDCLYLNVYRPNSTSNNLPVLVYIHGGAFQWGTADATLSGPDRIMNSQGAILVTVAYRLGALGFLSTGDSVAPGNFGLKDQSMAIRWVKTYISKFGGDSQLIMVFGEGTGAAAAQLHMMSPLSRGQFSRAILMSGTAFSVFARPDPDPLQLARLQVGVLSNAPYNKLTSLEVISYLRNISAAQIVGSIDAVKKNVGLLTSVTTFRLVIEQYVAGQSFLHQSPLTLWAAGNYEQIPWMVGHVPNEGIAFTLVLQLITSPLQWLGLFAQSGSVLTQELQLGFSATSAILRRFFGSTLLTTLSLRALLDVTYKLLTEVQFEYPLLKCVTQHLQHADPLKAPVSVYYMNFVGPYTIAPLVQPGSKLPIMHSDDLQYVLSRPLLFPDFAFGSPGYLMATKMVKQFVEFARTGYALPSYLGTCSSHTSCQQIVFSNGAADGGDPVQVNLTNALNTELLNFWDGLYNGA